MQWAKKSANAPKSSNKAILESHCRAVLLLQEPTSFCTLRICTCRRKDARCACIYKAEFISQRQHFPHGGLLPQAYTLLADTYACHRSSCNPHAPRGDIRSGRLSNDSRLALSVGTLALVLLALESAQKSCTAALLFVLLSFGRRAISGM